MVMGMNSGRLWKSTRKRLRAVERRNPYKYKMWIFVRSWEGAEQLWIGQDRILHLDQLKRHLSCAQHLRFAAMAGEDDDLTAVGGGKPFESCFHPCGCLPQRQRPG